MILLDKKVCWIDITVVETSIWNESGFFWLDFDENNIISTSIIVIDFENRSDIFFIKQDNKQSKTS